jgi:hypothetical protein
MMKMEGPLKPDVNSLEPGTFLVNGILNA